MWLYARRRDRRKGADVDGCETPVAQGCRIPAGGWMPREPWFGAQQFGRGVRWSSLPRLQKRAQSGSDRAVCGVHRGPGIPRRICRLGRTRDASVASASAASRRASQRKGRDNT